MNLPYLYTTSAFNYAGPQTIKITSSQFYTIATAPFIEANRIRVQFLIIVNLARVMHNKANDSSFYKTYAVGIPYR